MEEKVAFSQEVIDYIIKHQNVDPYTLALKKSPFQEVEMKVIARQIQGRKIAKRKFPFLLNVNQYVYPQKESLEQASSEATAIFKSNLISGHSFVDLTGGMGIDTYLLGKNFKVYAYVEPNQELYRATKRNFHTLDFDHCETFNSTCEDFLQNNKRKYDWAYIDPSRRIDGSRKTSINNYEPNVVDLQKEIAEISTNLLIKLSPMQDISDCVNVLGNVHKIWVISVQNEVKELLLHVKNDQSNSPEISAIELNYKQREEYTYSFEDRICNMGLGKIKKYLYQPSAVLVKAELQNRYASERALKKLHPNTQLYTSDDLIENFMGRIFLVHENINLNKKEIRRALPQMKTNIITKNFPLSPQELAKKYKLKEGGEKYLIGYSDHENQIKISICDRIK